MSNYTESQIADLIETFNAQAPEAPAPVARRTRIVEDVAAPVSGYRVVVEGFPVIDVEATDTGHAAALAHAIAKVTPGMWNYGGHIFLWNYIVVASDGTVTAGIDNREALQVARMRGK